MKRKTRECSALLAALLITGCLLCARSPVHASSVQDKDRTHHSVNLVPVDKDLKLEVLDRGGFGRPLILLAGLESTAHGFDDFVTKLTASFHVYGITRCGSGASSTPMPDGKNYSAARMSDDVLAVMDEPKFNRPVLLSHSIAGEQLSSIGTRLPESVAGLVYFNARYACAYCDVNAVGGKWIFDPSPHERELDEYGSPGAPKKNKLQIDHRLKTSLPRSEKDLELDQKQYEEMPENAPGPANNPQGKINAALLRQFQIYKGVCCPALAIFADLHTLPTNARDDPEKRRGMIAEDLATTSAQADGFQDGNRSARVVQLPQASHWVVGSNEADPQRE
jgi:non-heme chloroperoxidase